MIQKKRLVDHVIRHKSDAPTTKGDVTTYRAVRLYADRYEYDFCICAAKNGWRQYDTSQDASYYGVWVHMADRLVMCYAEGDVTLTVCDTRGAFRTELDSLDAFHGQPPPMAVSIDTDGTRTQYFDHRPVSTEVL